MNKGAIQRFAIWARNELIAQVSQRAYQYGITKEGCGEANAVTVGGRALTGDEQKQRKELVDQIRSKGYTQVMEEVAYTWFNRFIALRFMEVNNYLPSHIRVFSDSTGAFKPEILSDVLHLDLPGLNREKVAEYIESNDTEGLYFWCLVPDVADEGCVVELFRLDPKIFAGLIAIPLGIENDGIDQFEDVLLTADVRERVVVHGFPEVDGVQRLDDVAALFEHFAAFHQHRTFRVLSIRNKKKVSCF